MRQLLKLTAQVEDLAGALDPHPIVTVAVFDHETEEFAARRHVSLRPEHAGLRIRFDYRRNERSPTHEVCAVWAGATESDMFTYKEWMERRPSGLRNFLGFHEDGEDDCEGSLEAWDADYQPRWQRPACQCRGATPAFRKRCSIDFGVAD